MNDKNTDEFLEKLYALLAEYDTRLSADYMGDITLDQGNKSIGFWGNGLIEKESYRAY